MLVLTLLVVVGAVCSGVLLPFRNTATAGTPIDTETLSELRGGSVYQCCAFVVALAAFGLYRAISGESELKPPAT